MADIEPYKQIQKTNIKEHNDLVAKINEIIDVLNNTQIETVVPKITALENDVSIINATDSLQWTDIENLKDSQSAQDVTIGNLNTQVKGVTESLVSDIAIIDGITTGNMKVRIEREKATSIDSNDYNIQKPVSMELIQGSGPSTFKAQITLSDGTIIRSDDFMFTTEAIGTDVYISSFVFKNGNVAGTISADIGLSNGTTIEANNFVVPMDPSLLNTVQDLSTRLTAVEGGSVAGFKEVEAQVNTNKTDINNLTTELDNLDIKKADQSNSNQEIVAGTITANNITKGGINVATVNDIPDISGKVNIAQGVGNAGKMLGIDDSGNVTPTNLPSTPISLSLIGDPASLFVIGNNTITLTRPILIEANSASTNTYFFVPNTTWAYRGSAPSYLVLVNERIGSTTGSVFTASIKYPDGTFEAGIGDNKTTVSTGNGAFGSGGFMVRVFVFN